MNKRSAITRRSIALAACLSMCGTVSAHDASNAPKLAALIVDATTLVAQASPVDGEPAQPTAQARAVALRQSLATSEAQLRSYQWIETTFISQINWVQSHTEKQCYYGAGGTLQKVLLNSPEYFELPGLLPIGKLANKLAVYKEEEVPRHMKSAAELVHAYVLPDPVRIQQSVDAGKFSMSVLQPGRLVRLAFRDYFKPGDVLRVDIDLPTNRPVRIGVSSYLGTLADPVTLSVTMGMLADGTLYPARSILDTKATGIRVDVENSGHTRAR